MNKRNIRDKLDKIVSIVVRGNACNGKSGTGRCITCSKPITYYSSDCGHYIDRRHYATRWHQVNNHAQCISCNQYMIKADMQKLYRAALVERYTEQTVLALEVLKDDPGPTEQEMEKIYYEYRMIAKRLGLV